MSKKLKKLNEEKEILDKVHFIINKAKSDLSVNDKVIQNFIQFLFTNEYKNKKISLPTVKKEKDKFSFLSKYIELINSLFKKDLNERITEYKTPKSYLKDYHIIQLVQGLDFFSQQKEKELFTTKTLFVDPKKNNNLLYQVYSHLFNIIQNDEEKLAGLFDKYNFYSIFLFPNIPVVKFMLYNIIRGNFMNVMKVFDYEDFCPRLDNDNCLNFIVLFFENRESENIVLAFIYAFLFFKYEFVFHDYYDKKFSKVILEKAAIQTVDQIKSITLKNDLIFEYTYTKYLANLNKFLQEEKINILNSSNDSKENEKNNLKNNIKNEKGDADFIKIDINQDPNKNQINNIINIPDKKNENETKSKDKKTLQLKDNKNDEKNDFSLINKNKIKDTIKVPKIVIKKNFNYDKNKLNPPLKVNENIKKENIPMKNNLIEVNLFNSPSKKNIINDLDNIKKDDENSIKNDSVKSKLEIIKDNGKENLSSYEFLKKLYEDMCKRSEEDTKQSNERINLLEQKIIDVQKNSEKEINSLKIEIKNIKEILGDIQERNQINNLFHSFKSLLNKDEKTAVKNDNSLKGTIYLNAIKRKYNKYLNNEKFKIFEEIIKRSGETLNSGNKEAHSLSLDVYKEQIEECKDKFNIHVANVEKLAFLINIKMPENSFYKAYKYIDDYFQNNMETKILKGKTFEQSFVQ